MLILGCGNPDRGDDAAGRLVARRLRELGVAARENSGDALDLLDAWQGAGEIILVDAVATGRPPGTVSVWDALADPPPMPPSLGASHAFGWPEAVGLARMLGAVPPRITCYGIEAGSFRLGAPPRRAVLRAVDRVAREIYEYCVDQRRPAV